jgi:hypothetical protein
VALFKPSGRSVAAKSQRGKVLAEQSLASLWLDVHVSESTDTKDEKAVPIGNGEFMERPASTKTACPSDWTPYDFPT